jgi:hypothetical protein
MRTALPSLALAVAFATGLAAQNIPGESIPSPQQPQANTPAQQQPAGPVIGESQPSAQPPKLVRTPQPGEAPSDFRSPVVPIVEGVTETGQGAGPASGSNAVPAAQRTAFGNSNNNIPFSFPPNRYQQVFLGSELPSALAIQGIALRQDNQFGNLVGRVIDVEIYMGYSTFDQNTLTTTFATNYNAGPRTLVYARKMYKLPNMGPAPTDPNVFFAKIPFDNNFN